jgi:hypothetical protein
MDILVALKKEESQLLKHLNTIRRIMKRVKEEYKESGTKKKSDRNSAVMLPIRFSDLRGAESLSI